MLTAEATNNKQVRVAAWLSG